MSVARSDVVSQVADAVRQRIVDGELAPGARVNETQVAQELKVSRTPVREALGRLVGEGALISMPSFGFFVAEISEAELDQIYCLRPILDPAALELSGLPPAKTITELKSLNRRLAEAASAKEAVSLDEEWHQLLLDCCPNSILTSFIRKLMDQTRRYELLLFEDPAQRAATAEQHDRIIAALTKGDLAAACGALRANMTHGDQPIRVRIQRQKNGKADA